MAARLTINDVVIGLESSKVNILRLRVSYLHARELVFSEDKAEHQGSWNEEDTVVFEDPVGTVRFRGKVKERRLNPNEIVYTARGQRSLANDVTVVTGAGLPRVVFNAEVDDPDYPFVQDIGQTVGEIIKWLFDNHLTELRAVGACHPTNPPYNTAELDAMDIEVPSKVVFEGMTFDDAISQILTWQIGYVRRVDPVAQVWHFEDVETIAAQTVTLNDIPPNEVVISKDLQPSSIRRATAVSIHGPGSIMPGYVSTKGGSLTELWTAGLEADWTLEKWGNPENEESGTPTGYSTTYIDNAAATWVIDQWKGGIIELNAGGDNIEVASNTATRITFSRATSISPITSYRVFEGTSAYRYVYSRFQITDAAKRQIARRIPGGMPALVSPWVTSRMYSPIVLVEIPAAGMSSFYIAPVLFDYPNGIFITLKPVCQGNVETEGTASNDNMQVILSYGYVSGSISARYPAAGYEGTAYSISGIEFELKLYAPEYTDANDTAAYEKIAEELLKVLKNIVWIGELETKTIDYTYSNANLAINIDGLDLQGEAEVTGWESIRAYLDDVTYEYSQGIGTTQLRLNSDLAAISAVDLYLLEQLFLAKKLSWLTDRVIKNTEEIQTAIYQGGSIYDIHYTTSAMAGTSKTLAVAEPDYNKWVTLSPTATTYTHSASAPIVIGGNIIDIEASLVPGEFFVWEEEPV